MSRTERLAEHSQNPALLRVARFKVISACRQHDRGDHGGAGVLLEPLTKLQARKLRHVIVGDEQIRVLLLGQFQRLLSIARRDDAISRVAKLQRDDVENVAFIIRDQDCFVRIHTRLRSTGVSPVARARCPCYSQRSNSNPKQLPFPTCDSTKILPWCTVSTMCFTSDNPSPVPLAIRLFASAL